MERVELLDEDRRRMRLGSGTFGISGGAALRLRLDVDCCELFTINEDRERGRVVSGSNMVVKSGGWIEEMCQEALDCPHT